MLLLLNSSRVIKKYGGDRMINGKLLDLKENQDTEEIADNEVYTYHQASGELVAVARSNERGEYHITGLNKDKHFVVSHYLDESKNGEIADNIRPIRDPDYDFIK